jgi:hypothetical protein
MGGGLAFAQRHKVHQDRGAAVGGDELGFEDQRVVDIAALDAQVRSCRRRSRCDLPAPIVRVAQQGCKARRRVKAGQQSQSMEPSRETSAAVSQSPMRA